MIDTRLLFEGEESKIQWVIEYNMGPTEFDDSFEDEDTKQVILTAPDFDTAVRYAQQYLKKMQTEEETAELWQSAEILAVERY